MSVTVKPIEPTKANLRKFIQFGIDLYKSNPCYVPPLIVDDINTLLPDKNPAFEHCDAQSFMAFRDGKPVGRITAIINHLVNKKDGVNTLRFGFVDFIDDAEVVDALFKAASDWGRSRGCTVMIGPMGFSDMDHEGMLIEGFDEMGTMATIYNYPYYPEHMKRLGAVKEVDWVEFRMAVPSEVPEKYLRIADIVARKYKLRTVRFTSRKKLREQYGQALFDLINEAYADLYGYSPLTRAQIDHYINIYLGIIRLEDVSVVVDENDNLIAAGVSMPSLSKALRASGGKLFPFGWYHLLRAIRGNSNVVDLLLVAVKPEYQSRGVNALIFCDLIPSYIANGYKWSESNPELEGNESVQRQWEYFERRQHRRRRAWRLPL